MGVLERFLSSVEIEVTCHSAERFLNICADNGINFRDVKKISADELRLKVGERDCRFIERSASRYGYTVSRIDESGIVFTAQKIKRRYVLLFGMTLFIGALWLSSLFVWEIKVTGNERVPDTKILAQLEELGIGVGTFRAKISQEYVSNEMLQRIDELSFIAINVTGSRAEVVVREERESADIQNEDRIQKIVAEKSGVITKLTLFEGTAKVSEGDTVVAGDELVSAVKESVSSGNRLVCADAEIYARTWYELEAQMPDAAVGKTYTGDKSTRFAIILCGKRINLYFNGRNAVDSYDKIIETKGIEIFGTVLPIQIVKETAREYLPEDQKTDLEEAKAILADGLEERLRDEIGEDGEIVKTEFVTVAENGTIKMTLKAECIERIDKEAELSEEEKIAAEEDNLSDGENDQR